MAVELQVVSDFYDFLFYLTQRIEKYPRHHRYSLGLAMEQRLQTILALFIRAKYSGKPDVKAGLLGEINIELEVLRFQLRLSHDLKALATSSHGHAMERLQKIGVQVGGWLRSKTQRSDP